MIRSISVGVTLLLLVVASCDLPQLAQFTRADDPLNIRAADILTFDVATDDGAVLLSWPPTDKADGYHVYYAEGTDVSPAKGTLWTGATRSTGTTISGLKNGTQYAFIYVPLTSGAEGTPSRVLTATPGTSPTQVVANVVGSKILVTWTKKAGATSYNVYHSEDGGDVSSDETGVKPQFSLVGVDVGHTYKFWIEAVSGQAKSDKSSPISLLVPDATVDLGLGGDPSGVGSLKLVVLDSGSEDPAINDAGRIFYSSDGGTSWAISRVTSTNGDVVHLHWKYVAASQNGSIVYVTGWGEHTPTSIYKSTDGGANFTQLADADRFLTDGFNGLATSSDGQVVGASTWNLVNSIASAIDWSNNGGATWGQFTTTERMINFRGLSTNADGSVWLTTGGQDGYPGIRGGPAMAYRDPATNQWATTWRYSSDFSNNGFSGGNWLFNNGDHGATWQAGEPTVDWGIMGDTWQDLATNGSNTWFLMLVSNGGNPNNLQPGYTNNRAYMSKAHVSDLSPQWDGSATNPGGNYLTSGYFWGGDIAADGSLVVVQSGPSSAVGGSTPTKPWYSSDMGVTWTQSTSTVPAGVESVVGVSNAGELVVLAAADGHLYWSTDHGVTYAPFRHTPIGAHWTGLTVR